MFIILAAIKTFGVEKGMYAMLGVCMLCMSINLIMEKFNLYQQVIISSEKIKEIRGYIINIFGGKISIYYAKDGYSDCDNAIIMTVLKKKEFFKLKKYVDSIDENSFITAHDINEIHGNAYTAK